MSRSLLLSFLLIPTLSALLIEPAGALGILDQESGIPGSPATIRVDNDLHVTQEVVVGLTGDLTAIELLVVDPLGTSDGVCCFIQVHDGPIGGIAGTLGSAVYTPPGLVPTGWIRFDLLTPIAVAAGQVLSFGLIHDNVLDLATGTYAAGAMEADCGGDGCIHPFGGAALNAGDVLLFTDVDFAFRTFVVPEPGAALLLLSVALAARRRVPASA